MRVYPVQCAWQLGEGENKDYSVDLSKEIGAGETISTAVWTSDPDTLNFTTPSIVGMVVSTFVSGAVSGTAYHILLTVTTGVGKIVEIPLLIAGVDKTR